MNAASVRGKGGALGTPRPVARCAAGRVVVVEADGFISAANPAACAMLGCVPAGWNWQALARRCSWRRRLDEYLLAGRRVVVAESLLPSSGGRIVLIHDITAAHDMKASLERNQRLAAMGEMAASLAHQLRTPLATALLYSANLAKARSFRRRARKVRRQGDRTAQTPRTVNSGCAAFRARSGNRTRGDSRRRTAGGCALTMEPLCGEQGRFRVSGHAGGL